MEDSDPRRRARVWRGRRQREEQPGDAQDSGALWDLGRTVLIALASILAVEAGIADPDTLCAALLHNTIEDTDTSVEELVEAFGAPVASLV